MVRRGFYFVALLICGGLCAGELTPGQKQLNIESFERVWQMVRDTHWDPKFGGVDWQAVHEEFRQAVTRAQTMSDARQAISEMLGRLHQSHFAIIPADVYQNVDDKVSGGEGRTGIDVRVLNGDALVTAVDEGSPAAKAGVRAGWRIV